MKKIAILFVVFFCSVSLWAQTIEDDATWKLKTDTVRALKHYKAGDNWFIGIQAGANHSLSENSRFGSFGAMTRPSIARHRSTCATRLFETNVTRQQRSD